MNDSEAMNEVDAHQSRNKQVADGYKELIDSEGTLTINQCVSLLFWSEPDELSVQLLSASDDRHIHYGQRLRSELHNWVVNPKSPSEEWRLPISILANWSRENGIGACDRIEKYLGPFQPVAINDVPWDVLRRYRTPLIDGLLAVVQQFWVDYDKAKPETVPTQDHVLHWIKTHNPELSDNEAKVIDRVARHPDAKKGGIRKRKG